MLLLVFLLDALEPQSCLSRGGLLESLGPRDLCLLEGLQDDEGSLGSISGSSSALSISVPGS